jgi:hypothetical protein
MNTKVISSGPVANVSNAVKALLCGAIALAVTAAFSWSFIDASSVTRIRGDVPAAMYATVATVARHG